MIDILFYLVIAIVSFSAGYVIMWTYGDGRRCKRIINFYTAVKENTEQRNNELKNVIDILRR